MREIKFRGIDIHTGKFVYGDLVVNKPSRAYRIVSDFALVCDPIDYKGTELAGCSGLFHNVDPMTVGERTGLTDKNGKEIYEGDIVRILYTDWCSKSDSDPRTLKQYLADIASIKIVVYKDDRFCLQSHCSKMNDSYQSSIFPGEHGYIEVIGTIHEDKHLLK